MLGRNLSLWVLVFFFTLNSWATPPAPPAGPPPAPPMEPPPVPTPEELEMFAKGPHGDYDPKTVELVPLEWLNREPVITHGLAKPLKPSELYQLTLNRLQDLEKKITVLIAESKDPKKLYLPPEFDPGFIPNMEAMLKKYKAKIAALKKAGPEKFDFKRDSNGYELYPEMDVQDQLVLYIREQGRLLAAKKAKLPKYGEISEAEVEAARLEALRSLDKQLVKQADDFSFRPTNFQKPDQLGALREIWTNHWTQDKFYPPRDHQLHTKLRIRDRIANPEKITPAELEVYEEFPAVDRPYIARAVYLLLASQHMAQAEEPAATVESPPGTAR